MLNLSGAREDNAGTGLMDEALTELSVDNYSHEKHYTQACLWWTDHGWPVLPMRLLPRSGRVVLAGGKPVAMAFLYQTDSGLSWMEYVLSDKSSPKEVRGKALDLLITSIESLSKSLGFEAVFTSIVHPGLINRLSLLGWVKGDTNMTHMIKR